MKNLKKFSKKLFKNESGQGATEYILLLVVVVALVMIFKTDINNAFKGKVAELKDSIGNFKGE